MKTGTRSDAIGVFLFQQNIALIVGAPLSQ